MLINYYILEYVGDIWRSIFVHRNRPAVRVLMLGFNNITDDHIPTLIKADLPDLIKLCLS